MLVVKYSAGSTVHGYSTVKAEPTGILFLVVKVIVYTASTATSLSDYCSMPVVGAGSLFLKVGPSSV